MSDGHKLNRSMRRESATRRPKVLERHAGRPIRILRGNISTRSAAQKKKESGHRRDVRFRAHRIARKTAQARMAPRLKNTKTSKMSRPAGQASRGCAHARVAGNVALLRRSAAAFAQADHLVAHARNPAGALWFVPAAGRESWKRQIAERTKQVANLLACRSSFHTSNSQIPYISPELSFNFKYFFMRKLWFAQIAKP